MDNITHSLFGYALGRAAAGSRTAQPATALERALIATGVLASNAPDLDFVTGLFEDDRRLVYLLDHRGFTHTLLFALALGPIVGFACAVSARLRATRERLAVTGLGALACVLHVACDFLNDYGVHPFFPLDNRWYYGDSVFIVEPLWLAVLLPLPIFYAHTRAGRAISIALALGLVGLVVLAGVGPISVVLTLGVLVLACLVQRRLGARAGFALAASALVIAVFALGSRVAEAQLRAALRAAAPSERLLDIATAPLPANPTCFRALVVSLDPQRVYRARFARVGLLGPGLACRLLPAQPSAPLSAAGLSSAGGVEFLEMFAAPAAELSALARSHCDAAAMLRFVRVPFWQERADGSVLGDLRYDRAPALEFAERLLTGVCNSARLPAAPWVPPRADLLAAPVSERPKSFSPGPP